MHYNRLPWNVRIKKERQSRFWTQEELAEKLGTDQRTVGRWECGKCTPRYLFIRGLCKLFGKTPEQMGFTDPEDTNT